MEKPPLEGIRVADFSWVWAGPYCSMFMAAMGAEVIKIESRSHLDLARTLFPSAYADPQVHQAYLRWLSTAPEERDPFPYDPPGPDQCGYFNRLNHGKLSVTIDLKSPEGVEQARRLVAISDVVVENYSPRVMRGLGLDYASLTKVKPDIVYLALSGFGDTGPDRDNVMYGEGQVALSGLSSLTGYADGDPMPLPVPYPDPVGAMHGLIAVLAALRHRNGSGEGQYIDISQWESAMCLLPEGILEYTMNQRVPPRIGNRDPVMAPHGCYPCLGDDKWVTIAVGSEEEWRALCRALGRPDLIADERYATLPSRRQHQDELDGIIAAWTSRRTPYQVMEALQKVGVAATPSLNNEEIVKEPHLNQRGFLVEVDHPITGPRVHPGLPFRFGDGPIPIERAPLLGEHNEYVFCQLLGHTPEEVALLEKKGALR